MGCLYCSLRPLVYGMTTLAPSINFPVKGFCNEIMPYTMIMLDVLIRLFFILSVC